MARDPRLHVDLAHLQRMPPLPSRAGFLPRQPTRSVLNGRHASKLRGRGLNFEELRHYLPGDDPRTIDWKVTARTGEPFVRVYTEERDRPALLLVDQRLSMFFGTVHAMKSVTAAEAAALTARRLIDQGDRVGGIVFSDDGLAELKPARSRRAVRRFITALADANCALDASQPAVEPMSLNRPLSAAARIARPGSLVVVLSDFDGIDEETRKIFRDLARRCDVLLAPVWDPSSDTLPENLKIIASDGELQAEIDVGTQATRAALEEHAKGRMATLLDWSRRYGMPLLPLSAGEPTLPQMVRLLGAGRRGT